MLAGLDVNGDDSGESREARSIARLVMILQSSMDTTTWVARRCARRWLIAFVGEKSIGVLVPECGFVHQGKTRLHRDGIERTFGLCEGQ